MRNNKFYTMTEIMERKMLQALLGVKKEAPVAIVISREEMVAFILKYTNNISIADRIELLKLFKDSCANIGFSQCAEGVIINLEKMPVESILSAYKFITYVRAKRG